MSKDKENQDTEDTQTKDSSLLGHKREHESEEPSQKINNEYCALCRNGGNLLLCDNCVRSFHLECLKLEEDDIPEGNWFCPICTMQKDIKERKERKKNENKQEMDEAQRKRLIKNEKRRLWRRKKKEEEEAMKNKLNLNGDPSRNQIIDNILANNNALNQAKGASMKSYLGVLNRMDKLPLNNSKICLNITYTQLLDKNTRHNKSLSLPILFPIPNNIMINFYEKTNNLFEALNKRKITKYILENYSDETKYKFEDDNKDKDKEMNLAYNDYKDIINIDNKKIKELKSNSDDIDINEEINKLLKLPNSVKALNNMLTENKDLFKYNNMMRDYWNVILEKKSSTSQANKHTMVRYPINSKELYSFPDYHGLDEKYFKKAEGVIYPFLNGKIFTRLIGIYDFILTFSNKLYIDQFRIEEFYAALLQADKYKKGEIFLLTCVYISLVLLLIFELGETSLLDLYNKKEIELIMLKVIIEHKKIEMKNLYEFVYHTWPELVRLFLLSNTYSKSFNYMNISNEFLNKLDNVVDIYNFYQAFSFEDKIYLLEKLIYICYETNFVRNTIREEQDKKLEIKKREKELDDQLRDIEFKKREKEKENQFAQPEARIEEINNKIKHLSVKNRVEYKKNKAKLESEKEKYQKSIDEINTINTQRDEILFKISSLKEEYMNTPSFNKSYLGSDGRGYKYYFFNWMDDYIFLRVNTKSKKSKEKTEEKNEEKKEMEEEEENEDNSSSNSDKEKARDDKDKDDLDKYEWRIIKDKEILNNDIIDKLSEKGIEEAELKSKLIKIYRKYSNNNTNNTNNNNSSKDDNKDKDKDNKEKDSKEKDKEKILTIEEIFKTKTLKYENNKNPMLIKSENDNKKNTFKPFYVINGNNNYNLNKFVAEKIDKIEQNITKYLSIDNRQWESPSNRTKIKQWILKITEIPKFINVLLFFNERIKMPYKIELNNNNNNSSQKKDEKNNKKMKLKKTITDEEKEGGENAKTTKGDIFDENGFLNIEYQNESLTYSNRIRLWTKENESYNVEKIYISYLKEVKTYPQLIISANLFEIAIFELNRRKEFYKKKDKNDIVENKESKEIKKEENKKDKDKDKEKKEDEENVIEDSSEEKSDNDESKEEEKEKENNKDKEKDKDKKGINDKRRTNPKKKLIDWNVECMYCGDYGDLLNCQECPNAAHLTCTKLKSAPESWLCPNCQNKSKTKNNKKDKDKN